MAFVPGKPNQVPPDPRFQEWLEILLTLNPHDTRRLARYLAANDIPTPELWLPPIVGVDIPSEV